MERRPKILVMDTDPQFVEMIRSTFGLCFEVVSALDRREGLAKARKNVPDLIIIGYLKPRGTAFQVHKELRQDPATQGIPQVVVDVCPEEHYRKGWRRDEGLQMEAEDYLTRPVATTDLWESVARIWQRVQRKEPLDLKEIAGRMEEALKEIDRVEGLLVG